MDKKNTILGVICIAAGIGFMFWQSQQIEQQRIEQLQQAETLEAPAGQSTTPADAQLVAADANWQPDQAKLGAAAVTELFQQVDSVPALSEAPLAEEQTVRLSNEFIEAVFTTRGGAIKTVDFLQTKRGERDDYVFNQGGYLPALSLSYQASDESMREFALDYRV
ncbi:MAG TPA: hypothetical protein DEA90_11190, partial [Opitutae bacterium]|nr:hypothetical protein [Opitutae bacterium]